MVSKFFFQNTTDSGAFRASSTETSAYACSCKTSRGRCVNVLS
jgi:hypothetical protein